MAERGAARAPIGAPLPRLRAVRTARLLTQEALADKAGVARYTVRRIELGAPARFGTAQKLAAALDVEPAELMEPERPTRRGGAGKSAEAA